MLIINSNRAREFEIYISIPPRIFLTCLIFLVFVTCFSLNLQNVKFQTGKRELIEREALYAYATRAEVRTHNEQRLFDIHSADNPVARIKAITISPNIRSNHFDDIRGIPKLLEICIGARVEIRGKNLMPSWGLYNNSVGIVEDIVFKQNKLPNLGHLPLYVLVNFNTYRGPAFISQKPTLVPIAPITVRCDKKCCSRSQIPLGLSFARTIHTLQGISVGPTKPGQPKNSVPYLIASIGPKSMETCWTGLTYVVCSRPTTIGTIEDPSQSALFFLGNEAIPKRFMNIHENQSTGSTTKRWNNREKWMSYLESNKITSKTTKEQKQSIFDWYETEPIISQERLNNIIHQSYENVHP